MNKIETPGGSSPGVFSILVLGGYGLIGSAIMRRLMADGHQVTGAGRSAAAARQGPGQAWRIFDIASMREDDWRRELAGFDVVVNASGALQDGPRDNLDAIHHRALKRLGSALSGSTTRIVQISAAGVSPDAETEFFRTKAKGDDALRASGASHVILRPTLVLSPAAYGGTALLRGAAGLPFVGLNILPKTRIQCVDVDDLAEAVLAAVDGRIAPGAVLDVTTAEAVSLPDLIARTRRWLGFRPPLVNLPVPGFMLNLVGRLADVSGKLGWRSPLRSTALAVLRDGVTGDAGAMPRAGGPHCRPLDVIFETLPSTVQERWFSRAFLLFPLAIVTLALFWLLSGLIGLLQFGTAQDVLASRGMAGWLAGILVALGAVADIGLGLAVLVRKWAKPALLGMVAVSLSYLGGATIFAPDLWLDPLGPMVKVLPSIILAFFTLAFLTDR